MSTEDFELNANAFRKDTHIWPPGKDRAPAAGPIDEREVRLLAFDYWRKQQDLKAENANLKALLQDKQTISDEDAAHLRSLPGRLLNAEAENAKLKEVVAEFVSASPDCCWRKCWACGKVQIHREDVTPGVLCRFCSSQDTRLLKKETQALKENP